MIMAQARVTDYFATKKRKSGRQASKRQKLKEAIALPNSSETEILPITDDSDLIINLKVKLNNATHLDKPDTLHSSSTKPDSHSNTKRLKSPCSSPNRLTTRSRTVRPTRSSNTTIASNVNPVKAHNPTSHTHPTTLCSSSTSTITSHASPSKTRSGSSSPTKTQSPCSGPIRANSCHSSPIRTQSPCSSPSKVQSPCSSPTKRGASKISEKRVKRKRSSTSSADLATSDVDERTKLQACIQKVQDITKEIRQRKSASSKKSLQYPRDSKPEPASVSEPAYERYKDLAVKIPPTLTLPYRYKMLEDMFKGADTVISIMYNRLERCTFDKLKRAVQDMIRKNFETRHLGQIKTVYPESYEFRQETGIVDSGMRSNKYHLTIEPIINADKNCEKVTKRKDGRPVLASSEIVKRKEIFRRRLFDIVKLHHQRFLESLKPAVKLDSKKITRWHPKFLVDNVPDVEASTLPAAPEQQKELTTARDVLKQARGKVPSRVELALKKVAEATEKAENLKNMQKTKTGNKMKVEKAAALSSSTPAAAASTSGISSSLLERIRAKEALKAQASMLRDESVDREMDILGRLPEMIKILRSFFITERKGALTEDCVIVKLCDSYKSSISQSSVEQHMAYLLKVLPDWITKVSVSSGKYIKINRQTELSQLNKKLSVILKQKEYAIPGV